jgi:SagB-type dehydrogenase family enzyme
MEKRSKIITAIILFLGLILVLSVAWTLNGQSENITKNPNIGDQSVQPISSIDLPNPQYKGSLSVEEAIKNRRSVRSFNSNPITIEEVSQLLWSAQGITDPQRNYRAAPSGSHVFPLQMYLVTGKNGVKEIPAGIYRYDPYNNRLEKIEDGDIRNNLSKAAHNQSWVKNAPISLIITGNYEKMMEKNQDIKISTRFVDMEAGHVGENIYLQAESLGLGTVAIGSFYEDQMISLLKLPHNETPLYIYPVGHTS